MTGCPTPARITERLVETGGKYTLPATEADQQG
jgi:hypothetical protein